MSPFIQGPHESLQSPSICFSHVDQGFSTRVGGVAPRGQLAMSGDIFGCRNLGKGSTTDGV